MLDAILGKLRSRGLDLEQKVVMPTDAENITYGEAEELLLMTIYELRKEVGDTRIKALEAEFYGVIDDLKNGYVAEAAHTIEKRQRRFGSKEMKIDMKGNLVDEFENLLLPKELMPGRRHRPEA